MAAHPVRYTYREYLALDATSNVKLEYLDGQVYAMAGGSPNHAALQAALPSVLFATLKVGPCRAFGADLRVRVLPTGLATYPDVTVIRGPRRLDPDDPNTVVDATAIFEVLSPSTEEYDRGEKFESYKKLPGLRHYVLVAQDQRCVEVWERSDDGAWSHAVARDGEVARLDAIGATLDVRELYNAAAPG